MPWSQTSPMDQKVQPTVDFLNITAIHSALKPHRLKSYGISAKTTPCKRSRILVCED